MSKKVLEVQKTIDPFVSFVQSQSSVKAPNVKSLFLKMNSIFVGYKLPDVIKKGQSVGFSTSKNQTFVPDFVLPTDYRFGQASSIIYKQICYGV